MNGPRPPAIRHPIRVELLSALSAGEPLDLDELAAQTKIRLETVRYHADVLRSEGMVRMTGDRATITESGLELHRLAQLPDRRRVDRRHSDDRRIGG